MIELLLSLRYKYDDYLFSRQDNSYSIHASEILPFHDEVLATYADLDTYIENCNLSQLQLKMLELVGREYTHDEISFELNILPSSVKSRLETIYKRIKKENDWQYNKYFFTHKLNLKTKQCSKCRENLPAVEEFYSNDNRNKDGFQGQCRKCKN